ncbi:hypothetical protein PHISCL_09383 [Aspergillus sclerotialis]|uniref:F-box domain-containing protein n=1 Tax=Aspergillus sclerotialis TaxID=2070753 RepID=A0A3A2Z5D5_9EURO|nr:hypothetical protein PHISCL_09383 [Aspergillus sclerotialis]
MRSKTIAHCPLDILYLVVKLLSPDEWRTLCLVNRNFHAIAEPLLYSKIQWSWQHKKRPPPILQFLQTIISRPELAVHVTNIQLEGKYLSNNGNTYSIPLIPVSGAELDKEIEFIQRSGVSYSDVWIQELRKGVTDAAVALLLAQLLNLRRLVHESVFLQRSTLIGMVLRSTICESGKYRLPSFPHLRHVSVLSQVWWDRAREAENVQNTPDFLPLFYLRNVECMSVSIKSSAAFEWPVAYLPEPSRLTSLHLTSVREAHLSDMLQVTKNLRKLSWEWYYDYGLDDEFNKPIVYLDHIDSALSHVPPTLRELNISADIGIGGNDCWYPGVSIKGSLHKMADLHHVKRLQIPLAFLVGFVQDTTKQLQDMMPRNIEFVTLTYDLCIQEDPQRRPDMPEWDWEDSGVLGLLQSWLGFWKSCTPCLCGILLIVESPEEHIGVWDSDMIRRLSDLSIRSGIQIDIERREILDYLNLIL